MASFNASSPSAGGGVAVISNLDSYGLFHVTAYFSNVRFVPARVVLTVWKPGWTQSRPLADLTSGIVDLDRVWNNNKLNEAFYEILLCFE